MYKSINKFTVVDDADAATDALYENLFQCKSIALSCIQTIKKNNNDDDSDKKREARSNFRCEKDFFKKRIVNRRFFLNSAIYESKYGML